MISMSTCLGLAGAIFAVNCLPKFDLSVFIMSPEQWNNAGGTGARGNDRQYSMSTF